MPFDPEKRLVEKYPDTQLIFLDPQTYQAELTAISERVIITILNAQEEYKRVWNEDYPVFGVIVYGGWGRARVHTQSDFDIALIASEELGIMADDFANRLRKSGIMQEIAPFWGIVVSDSSTVEELREQNKLFFQLIGEHYKVITSDQKIAALFVDSC